MDAIVTNIIEYLTGSITGIGTAVGEGISSLVKTMIVTGSGTSGDPYALSVFGVFVCIFAGLSLAFGLCRWAMNFVSSLGARNR